MAIQFPCCSCGKTLSVADEYVGRQARCPSCQTVQVVPSDGGISTPVISFGSPLGTGSSDFGGMNSGDTARGFSGATSGSGTQAPGDSRSAYDSPTPVGSQPETLSPLSSQASPTGGAGEASGATFGREGSTSSASDSTGDIGSPFARTPDSAAREEAGAGLYYLEMPGGEVYGPVDWNTLVAWKNQGRVGANYRVRRGESGAWQVASATLLFSSSVNPYADRSPNGASPYAAPHYQYAYSRQDRSGVILTIGILSLVLLVTCGPFATILGIIAWILGAQDMRAMRDGQLDPNTKGTLQTGYYLGMASTLLSVLCFGGYILMIIFSIIVDANGF